MSGSKYNTDWNDVVRDVRTVQSSIEEMQQWSRWKEEEFIKASKAGLLNKLEDRTLHPLGLTPKDVAFHRWLQFNGSRVDWGSNLTRLESDLSRKVDQMRKAVQTGDLGEALAQSRFLKPYLSDVEKLITQALSTAHPAKFSYKGFRITNPYRMAESIVKECLDAISAMVALFKRRSVEGLLLSSVAEIRLMPSATWSSATGGGSHGLYSPANKMIVVTGDAVISSGPGKFLKNWVHEVFLHEFGHHVHLSEMTSDAKTFWNEGWSEVWKAEADDSTKRMEKEVGRAMISDKEIERFWKTFKATNYNVSRASSQFNGVDEVKFKVWLHRGRIVNQNYNLTKEGKQRVSFLRSYPGDRESWAARFDREQRKLYNQPFQDFLDEGLRRYDEEHEGILSSLRIGITGYRADIYLQPNEIEQVQSVDSELRESFEADRRKDDLGIPSGYGRTNPMEDFAETFVLWMTNPKKLSPVARWRMGRSLWLSGYGGKPIMRLGTVRKVAEDFLQTRNVA